MNQILLKKYRTVDKFYFNFNFNFTIKKLFPKKQKKNHFEQYLVTLQEANFQFEF